MMNFGNLPGKDNAKRSAMRGALEKRRAMRDEKRAAWKNTVQGTPPVTSPVAFKEGGMVSKGNGCAIRGVKKCKMY